MYDPKIGRWLSEDPAGLTVDANPYLYVHNSPTNYTDPSGLVSLPIGGYGYVGGGYRLPGGLGGVEGGVGGYCGTDGVGVGLEGYGYVGGSGGAPLVGGGGWVIPGEHGYGPIVGWGIGVVGIEGYYDIPNDQSYVGIGAGEGMVGGLGVCFNGNIFPKPKHEGPPPPKFKHKHYIEGIKYGHY